MAEKVKVIVDAFGGDNAPGEIIAGAVSATVKYPDIEVILSGGAEVIKRELEKYPDAPAFGIIDAPEIITNDDVPTAAVRCKKNSSLVAGLNRLREDGGVSAFVSAGSTGAVLTGATLIVGRIEGVSRPALAPFLPTVTGGRVLLLDIGANVDCKPVMLAHFAVLGVSYLQAAAGIENPRAALLSNGTEDKKGNELTRAAFSLLKKMPINFAGNMEARDITSGNYDLIISDGFAGNVALKATEGAAATVLKLVKQTIKGAGLRGKIGYLFLRKAFKKLKQFDYEGMGGAPFLGVKKLVIKSHGSSDRRAVEASIKSAADTARAGLIAKIEENMIKSKEVLENLTEND